MSAPQWKAELIGVTEAGPAGRGVFAITEDGRNVAEYVWEKHAALIASAPDLFEALQACVDAFDEKHLGGAVTKQARLALTRARGEGVERA